MLMSDLLDAPVVHTGEWQALNTAASPAHATHELEDVSLVWERVPASGVDSLVPAVDVDWAAEHFRERVSGIPYNPAPSHLSWPYAVRGNADHTNGQTFDHTYPERFWPKYAGLGNAPVPPVFEGNHHKGIRFNYGDLSDVVDLLVHKPLTRQAYLPVWFPEDTGAGLVSYGNGQTVRVPCTLGYHFMQRGGRLSMRYYIRSCDAYRHLSNDIYLAAALLNWVCDEVTERNRKQSELPMRFRPGGLVMHISSLHSFVGDSSKMKQRIEEVSR
jgi:hypothetical protein